MNNKQYLVSESELIRILDYAFGHVTEIENYIKDVLKSKQPAECIRTNQKADKDYLYLGGSHIAGGDRTDEKYSVYIQREVSK